MTVWSCLQKFFHIITLVFPVYLQILPDNTFQSTTKLVCRLLLKSFVFTSVIPIVQIKSLATSNFGRPLPKRTKFLTTMTPSKSKKASSRFGRLFTKGSQFYHSGYFKLAINEIDNFVSKN